MTYPEDELAVRRAAKAAAEAAQQERIRKMENHEYEMNEARMFQKQLAEVEKAPLSERKEAAREFADAMANDPDLVGERIEWIFNGSYGWGAMKAAERVMGMSKNANKRAMLTQMVGALEWHCPARMEVAAWKKLTAAQKAALDKAVDEAMAYHGRMEK